MSPNTTYEQTEDGMTVAGYEYGIDIFEDYFKNGIPPHARLFLWECMDASETARAFDAGEEHGSSFLREQVAYAAQSYHELSADEKRKLHEKKLVELKHKKIESEEMLKTYRVVTPRLLSVLADLSEHKSKFEEVIRKVWNDAENNDAELAADLDDEEEFLVD